MRKSKNTSQRFRNRTLHELLCTLSNEKKRRLPEHLHELVHAYNVTSHATTGYSPYYFLYGVEPHLPADALLANENPGDKKLLNSPGRKHECPIYNMG